MGKAAENERIKLKATWINNVSVGLFLGGFVIPYLALFQRSEPQQYLDDWSRGKYQLTDSDVKKIFAYILA